MPELTGHDFARFGHEVVDGSCGPVRDATNGAAQWRANEERATVDDRENDRSSYF